MEFDRVIYGFQATRDGYHVRGFRLYNETDSLRKKMLKINELLWEHPEVDLIYEAPNSSEMREYFLETIRNKRYEDRKMDGIDFKVTLEKSGILVFNRKTDAF